MFVIWILVAAVLVARQSMAAPQPQGFIPRPEDAPEPYDFQYKVENPPTDTYFGQNEAQDPAGRVTGSYYVYLPDGRLLTVEYTADDQTGFVPRVSYQQQNAVRPPGYQGLPGYPNIPGYQGLRNLQGRIPPPPGYQGILPIPAGLPGNIRNLPGYQAPPSAIIQQGSPDVQG